MAKHHIVGGVLGLPVKIETGAGRAIDGARAKWNESYRQCNPISDPPTLTKKRRTEGEHGSLVERHCVHRGVDVADQYRHFSLAEGRDTKPPEGVC